jgi:high-affinity Fe2+/Pb2+ permease
MKEFEMRTLLASAMLAAAVPAFAHEGHGEIDFHWHGGDLLTIVAMVVAVGVWLWRRSGR